MQICPPFVVLLALSAPSRGEILNLRPVLASVFVVLSLAGCAAGGRVEGFGSTIDLRRFLYPDAFSLEELASESGFPQIEQHLREHRAEEAVRLLLGQAPKDLDPQQNLDRLYLSAATSGTSSRRAPRFAQPSRSSRKTPEPSSTSGISCGRWGEEPPAAVADEVLGVIVEDHSPGGTLVITAAFADGTPRLLASTGGGVLGEASEFRESTREAVANVIDEAQKHLPLVPEAKDLSLPGPDTVRVVLLTRRGVYAREETWQSMPTSEVSRLGGASQQLMLNLGTYFLTG